MINVGIVAEYNPFHNGHLIQIKKIREHFYPEQVRIIALMSGNFVQRGDIAVADKYTRAMHAVKQGVDLVLELPFPFSMSGAESFAGAACGIFDRLCDIDYIAFGSECGDVEYITECAVNLLSESFQSSLSNAVSSEFSLSYAALREQLYKQLYGKELPTSPNDILALEYVKALLKRGSKIMPLAFKREQGYSATSSRAAILSGQGLGSLVPHEISKYFEETRALNIALFNSYITQRCALADPEDFENTAEYCFDLAAKTVKSSQSAESIDELVNMISDKRYTKARVRRGLLSFILGVKKEDFNEKISFVFVLALGKLGRQYLSKKKCDINTVTRISGLLREEKNSRLFVLSSKADALCQRKAEELGLKIPKKPYAECEN